MKQFLKNISPVVIAVGLGIAAAAARVLYYINGTDEKNLLISGHPMGILVWVITAAALVLIPLSLFSRNGSNRWKYNFRPNFPAALGCAALSAGLFMTALSLLGPGADMPALTCGILGLVSGASTVWLGICRMRGKRPFFGCHGVLCLFFAFYLIDQYRTLSSNPQLQDYVFFMTSCVCMGLAAYQHAAFDLSVGSRRRLMLFSLVGAFLGLAASYRAMNLPLCLGGTLWMLTNLCRLKPTTRYLRKEK